MKERDWVDTAVQVLALACICVGAYTVPSEWNWLSCILLGGIILLESAINPLDK